LSPELLTGNAPVLPARNWQNNAAEPKLFTYEILLRLPESERWQYALKRAADIILSVIGLAMLSPLLLLIAIAVYISSPGPVLYKSMRIGKDYKPFYMYKFRTMVINAEQQRETLLKNAKLDGQLFKLKRDPRVTRLGEFLRKYSLDEFPQLFNVIRGEMSLVGPRPYIPEESKMFKSPYTVRFALIPGITGPWQANGRSNLNFHQLCELEMNYIRNWTVWLDLKLLFKTIPSVVLKKGAY
jgi:lipopolysaccharide/colanic/teichoic acid biosynthesis glycosyltransferase